MISDYRRFGAWACAFSVGMTFMALMASAPWPVSVACGVVSLCLAFLASRYPKTLADTDVWALQRSLMTASGQRVLDSPQISHGFLLYLALTMEELAETLSATVEVIPMKTFEFGRDHHLVEVCTELIDARDDLGAQASRLRLKLGTVAPGAIEWPLTRAQAVTLLDGITDVMVTAAGLAPSSGLPGREAYIEVQESNWSKANPETGLIDKEPSGKWIKGPNYRPPNLGAILDLAAGNGIPAYGFSGWGADDYPNHQNRKLGDQPDTRPEFTRVDGTDTGRLP